MPDDRSSLAGMSLVGLPGSGRVSLPATVTAAVVGGYRWTEQALYQLLGSWVPDAGLPQVQVHLDAQAARHAWHAELWAARLPVRDGVDPEALTVAPPPVEAVLALLAGAGSAPTPGEEGAGRAVLPRLAGLYRVVLPRMVATYERHLALTATVADGPLVRALRLVLADEIDDWHAGERLLQQLLTPADLAAAHAAQSRVEGEVVGAGVGVGLMPAPGGAT